MKSHSSGEKGLIVSLLCFAIGGVTPMATPILGSGPAGRTGRPLTPSERSSYEDQRALEAYHRRNAQIDSRIQEDVVPSDNNAALLYYQGFMRLPDANGAIRTKINDVYGGAEADTQTRIFLGKCLPALELFEVGSLMRQCTWGVLSDEQNSRNFLGRKLNNLSYVISVDASALAEDGHYRGALEQCLTLRRIARHLNEDPQLYFFSTGCDLPALRTMGRILGKMTPNADVLTWFEGQLGVIQVTSATIDKALQKYLEAKMDMIQTSSIVSLKGMLLKRAGSEEAKQDIEALTDEQIPDRAIETVQGLFGSVFAILHSDKSAEEKNAAIQGVTSYTLQRNIREPLNVVYKQLGGDILDLVVAADPKITQEEKLSKVQKIVEKLAEPGAIEALTKFSNVLGEEIDLGFLTDGGLTDKQRLAGMQKVIDELRDAYVIQTSSFGFSWGSLDSLFESQIAHTAEVNSIKAAVGVYLVVAKTGQLPKELPDSLAKDPYTGRDFLYETTEDGFVLGCQSDIFKRGKERFIFRNAWGMPGVES